MRVPGEESVEVTKKGCSFPFLSTVFKLGYPASPLVGVHLGNYLAEAVVYSTSPTDILLPPVNTHKLVIYQVLSYNISL